MWRMWRKIFTIIIAISIIFFIEGCKGKDDPKDTLQAYIKAWQNNEFNNMYQNLIAENKKNISEKDFVQKYTNIYNGIEVKNLVASAQYPKDYETDNLGNISFRTKKPSLSKSRFEPNPITSRIYFAFFIICS